MNVFVGIEHDNRSATMLFILGVTKIVPLLAVSQAKWLMASIRWQGEWQMLGGELPMVNLRRYRYMCQHLQAKEFAIDTSVPWWAAKCYTNTEL